MQPHFYSSSRMHSFERRAVRLSGHSTGLLLVATLLFSMGSMGAEQAVTPAETTIPQTEKSDNFDSLEDPRNYLSGRITNFVSEIDRFFGGDRHYQESNPSVIQLSVTRGDGYGGAREFDLAARLNLRLPVTEGRLRLLLETDPEKNATTGQTPVQGNVVQPNKVVAPKSLAVALRLAAEAEAAEEKAKAWHFSTDAGIKFPIPVQPFARARGSFSTLMGSWRVNAAESVYWFSKLGAGETTQLDLERIFSDIFMFRASTNATWLNDQHNLDLRQDISLYHTMDDRTALLYQASAIGVSKPQFQVTDYVALIDYRYRMHQKWLFFEFSPQLHFPKARNYKISPSLTMRIEILFDDSR